MEEISKHRTDIEKAVQRQQGDLHPTKPWYWETSANNGKGDWRKIKNTNNKKDDTTPPDTKKVGKPTPQQIANAKVRGKGKPMDTQKLLVWVTKTDEANLIKVTNSKNGNAQMRKITYDELEKRGYDMSKIDTSGSLGQLMKMTGSAHNPTVATSTDDDTDVDTDDDDTVNNITEKWYLDKNDERVKKKYNLKTKDGRIKYDQFVFNEKKKEKDYMNPVEVVQDLNEQYLEFLDNDEQRFMISAGGAGVGKSYGFTKIAELLNKKPFGEGDSPGDEDYDYFEAPDVNSGKQLLNILKAHNGKIIVFDDNDKVLRRTDCAAVMKKATSTTGVRMIGDPDDIKQNFEFTGRIIVMTNKNLADLSENEDSKAIISRAMMVSEIYMTIPETIEVMENRYQDFEFKQAPRLDDEHEDRKEREEILNLIKKNQNNIDPAQFTTRTFQEILINKRKVDNANAKRKNPAFASMIGSDEKDWKEKAVATITKAADVDFGNFEISDELQKAEETLFDDFQDEIKLSNSEPKSPSKEIKKSQPKSPSKEIKKSQPIDLFEDDDMALEKAEMLLLGGD